MVSSGQSPRCKLTVVASLNSRLGALPCWQAANLITRLNPADDVVIARVEVPAGTVIAREGDKDVIDEVEVRIAAVRRRPASRRAQRGVTLLVLLAVVVTVFAYVLTSRLNAESQFVAVDRHNNARVLSQAKLALIGWMAINAATDNNPGRLPCPEAVNAIGTSSEGISAPLVTPSTPNCATVGRLPWRTLGLNKLVDAASEPLWYAVSPGWALQNSSTLLSINSDRLGAMVVDGQAAPNEVVALIIAPGPPMNVQAAGACTARLQARNTPAPAMNPLDYIECYNPATPSFSTTGPATSFNDQVMRVTVADLMPALEAAIAERTQREIAPTVRSAAFELDTSSPRRWVAAAPLPSGNPSIYPYAAPFADPTAPVSTFLGVAATNQGLMPFAPVASAVAYASTPPNVIKTSSSGKLNTVNCAWEVQDDVYACEGEYEKDAGDPTLPVTLEMTALFTNVAMGFRARNTAALTAEARDTTGAPWSTASISTSKRLEMNDGSGGKPRGSVTARLSATLPNIPAMGWGTKAQYRLRVNRLVVNDHPLLSATGRALRFSGGSSAIGSGNTVTGATSGASGAVQVLVTSGDWSTSNAQGMLFFSSVSGSFASGETLLVGGSPMATAADTDFDIGWFVRNEWYRNIYYAVAPNNTPDSLPSVVGGCNSTDCLRFNDPATRNIRALLVLGGRGLPTRPARPSIDPLAYVEDQNGDAGSLFEMRRPRTSSVAITIPPSTFVAPWNDRIILVDWIAPNPTFPLAYLP